MFFEFFDVLDSEDCSGQIRKLCQLQAFLAAAEKGLEDALV